jgi:hypothetical protein
VQILAGDRGGFRVYVEVYKDLEDLPQPIGIPGSSIPTGTAVFSEAPTVDRRNEVIGIASGNDHRWIPAGRDCAYEQRILQKIRDRAARPRCGISD